MFGNLLKAAVGVAILPVDVVADAVTLGGVLTDRKKPYVAKRLENISDNIDKALDPEDE